MRKILLVLFVLMGLCTKAQYIYIPDPVYKAQVIQYFDANANNELDSAEALTIIDVDVSFGVHDVTGTNAFTNMTAFKCRGTQVDSIFLSGLPNLKAMDFQQNNNLKYIEAVNLPAAEGFYCYMNSTLDKINLSGLQVISSFECAYSPILNVDLSTLPSLQYVGIGQTPVLSSLNLTGLTNLNTLGYTATSTLAAINFSSLINLKTLECLVDISSYTVTGLSKLTTLKLRQLSVPVTLNVNNCVELNSVTVDEPISGPTVTTNLILGTGLDSLKTLDCNNIRLTGSLDLHNCTNLRTVDCSNNTELTSLNVSGLSKLTSLNCRYNRFPSIDLSSCTALVTLTMNYNFVLTSLDVSASHSLKYLYADNNLLNSLNVNGAVSLERLECQYNHLINLDVSGCPVLTYLKCNGNDLVQMNLKNGPTALATFDANQNWLIQYVCADEAEIASLQGYFLPTVSINSYCSFTPGGSYNTISGNIRADLNNNGCDPADPVLPNMIVKLDEGSQVRYTSIDTAGDYKFYTNAGSFTVTVPSPSGYFSFTPPSAVINFATTAGNLQTADFCLAPNGAHPDLEITVLALNTARPGFNANYEIVYKNKGTTTLSGNVELIFDDARLNLVNANPAATTQSTNLLNWTYSNLAPFESRTIAIQFHLLPPPDNNMNDTLNLTANITPLAGDETPRNNGFILRQVIRGSFDPNDKTCLEGAGILITDVGDYAHYLIRFQNTGTDTAFNVVIKDILTNKFDWNSFEVTKTSHPFVLRQTSGNKLEFIFENINLPDSNVNEPASHGFIAFKIKTIPTLILGDSVKNNASIYFDFNLPVVTNTATSYIVSNIIVPISIEYFKGSKQSGNHLLNWKAACTSSQATFDIERSTDARKFSSLTSITASNTRCLQPFNFTDNNPAAGINYYRIKMTDVDGKVSYSTVIALLNKKTGFEIVNLTPNPVTDGTAFLNVTSAEKQIIHIKVTDASGKIVQSIAKPVISGFTNINMNFSNLPAGIYTIIIHSNDAESKTKQFVKQ